jgi:hypothetical protein
MTTGRPLLAALVLKSIKLAALACLSFCQPVCLPFCFLTQRHAGVTLFRDGSASLGDGMLLPDKWRLILPLTSHDASTSSEPCRVLVSPHAFLLSSCHLGFRFQGFRVSGFGLWFVGSWFLAMGRTG